MMAPVGTHRREKSGVAPRKLLRLLVVLVTALAVSLCLYSFSRGETEGVSSGLDLYLATAQAPGVRRTDLQRHDLSIPGREVVQVRVDIAPGVVAPRHSHPGEEIVYVIEGSLEYRLDGKPPVTLAPGGVLFIPAGTIHAATNVGSDNGAELATYVVEKGKPLVVVAE